MNESWKRRALYFAGAWNILGGAGALLDPSGHFTQMYHATLSLDEPLQAFFFRATWINVIAWGIGYVLAGRHLSAYPILIAGGLGKLAYFGACVVLFMSGQARTTLLAAGVFDLLFAALFAYIVWSRPNHQQVPR